MGFHPIVFGGQASDQSIDQTVTFSGSNQNRTEGHHAVGTRGVDPETGRVWRYALIGDATLGNAVVRGGLCIASTLSHANHDDITLTDSAASSRIVAGDTSFVLRESDVDPPTDIVANQYKYGFVHVQDDGGNTEGQGFYSYILGHSAFDASGSATDGVVHLQVALDEAWGTNTQIALTRNPYDRIGPATTTAEELAVGVANVAHSASGALATDVTAASSDVNFRYAWVQTWGPCAVLQGGTPTQGLIVRPGTAANEVEVLDYNATGTAVDNTTVVGVALTGGTADGDYALVDLRIAA